MNHTNHKRRTAWYGATIFFSSAFLLVLEIVAGRLIAPYVGVSLYTWTSIIGVILAGLSAGNWLGGVWADRGGSEQSVGVVLAGGGLASLAVLLILTVVAPLIQNSGLNLLSASFLYVLTLFFIPALLLGIVTPLLTTLALRLDSQTGHVVGRMHALAALGSILGTFVTGYWLVGAFGTRAIILGTAVGLLLFAVPFLRGARSAAPAALLLGAGLIALGAYMRQGFANPCQYESDYFCIRVVDDSGNVPFGIARTLILDHLVHGTNHETEPAMLVAPYVHLMDELVLAHFGGDNAAKLRYFFAGGGAYTQPRAIKALTPDAEITVAELDPKVTEVARADLFFDADGITVMHADARVALHRLEGKTFDVIVTDVFHDVAIPYHLTTREFAKLVKARLAPGGLYTMNVVDVFPDARLVKSMVKTLQGEFRHVDAWLETLPQRPMRMTYVISASDLRAPPDRILAQRGFERTWYRITEPLLHTGTPLAELPELTDDFVPVERLVASLLLGKAGL